MNRGPALAITLLFTIGFWYFSDMLYNFEIGGFDIPFFGHFPGLKPFAGLAYYGTLIISFLSIMVFYVLTRNREEYGG